MSFSAIKLGGWAFGEILTSAQMNYVNGALPQAIDGAGGGTYANVAEIHLTGDFACDGVVTFDNCTLSGALVAAAATLSALTVSGATALTSLTVDDNTTLGSSGADTVHALGPVTLDSTLLVKGNTTLGDSGSDTVEITGPATLDSTLLVKGNTTLGDASSDTVSVVATATFSELPVFSGGLAWRQTTGTDAAGVTYSAHYNFIRWPPLGTNRTATIDTDGSGNRFMFVALDGTGGTPHDLTVNFPGGATITFTGGASSQCALFIHNGTQWLGPIFKA